MSNEYQEVYDRMRPILDLAKCRKLKKREISKALEQIEQHPVFQALKSYYEEMPLTYWDNLELMGDMDDLVELNERKKALKELWRTTHAQSQKVAKSTN